MQLINLYMFSCLYIWIQLCYFPSFHYQIYQRIQEWLLSILNRLQNVCVVYNGCVTCWRGPINSIVILLMMSESCLTYGKAIMKTCWCWSAWHMLSTCIILMPPSFWTYEKHLYRLLLLVVKLMLRKGVLLICLHKM